MSEKKTLNEEELDEVAGGVYYKTFEQMTLQYEKGYETEICDWKWSGLIATHTFTHRAKIIKRGYFLTQRGFYSPCYYFQGIPTPEPDVDGWYPEDCVSDMEKRNYADDKLYRNCGGAAIIEVD